MDNLPYNRLICTVKHTITSTKYAIDSIEVMKRYNKGIVSQE